MTNMEFIAIDEISRIYSEDHDLEGFRQQIECLNMAN